MSKTYQGRAIVFRKPLCAEVHDDVIFPKMDPDGVVLRTTFSGVSRGTELSLYAGRMHGSPPDTQWYPILPGYLPVGEVVEVGGNVTHLKVGDRAVVSNLFTGFDDRYCPAWAGHTQYVVVSKHSHGAGAGRAVKVPDGVDSQEAAFAVLAAIAYHGISVKVKPQPGETVLVVGAGAIGNAAAQLCKLAGCRVIVADLDELALRKAEESGADVTINSAKQDLWSAVRAICKDEEPQAIIDVTGSPRVLEQCLLNAPWLGRVHAQGMYLQPITFSVRDTLFAKCLTLSSTVGEQPAMVKHMLELMAGKQLRMSHLITRTFPVDQAPQVYRWLYEKPHESITAGFVWSTQEP